MTANPDILYTVTIFTSTDENVARTFDLHALEDVNGLFWRCYSLRFLPVILTCIPGKQPVDLTRNQAMKDCAQLLRAIAEQVLQARLSAGARVLDATDFREWLSWLKRRSRRIHSNSSYLRLEQEKGGNPASATILLGSSQKPGEKSDLQDLESFSGNTHPTTIS